MGSYSPDPATIGSLQGFEGLDVGYEIYLSRESFQGWFGWMLCVRIPWYGMAWHGMRYGDGGSEIDGMGFVHKVPLVW